MLANLGAATASFFPFGFSIPCFYLYRMAQKITREEAERVARIYKTNRDAAAALDIAPQSFGRLCRKFGIETPYDRRMRRKKEDR
ncbi:MAG: hypothetical protein HOC74_30245 [Gemmatimonadetes bacterium]|nr:hypothetical protein [Gemmatimonadota bacterium]